MSDELAVQQVLARYVRAHDRRDGAAMAALFTPDARVTMLYNNNPDREPEVIGELTGREAIAQATTHMMKPHPPRGWSHNVRRRTRRRRIVRICDRSGASAGRIA